MNIQQRRGWKQEKGSDVDEKVVVVVAVKASKKIRRTALVWALRSIFVFVFLFFFFCLYICFPS
ncbi:hypothetical protein Scep_027106 [Stephania cephalantha]|uniref:Transmembrane protein n=1 Tax=Stephania cephalantha TaxID=152367 RepID=A0AAP0HSL2_9MAGN